MGKAIYMCGDKEYTEISILQSLNKRLLHSLKLWSGNFFKDLFIFRERGREGERDGEKHQYVVASHTQPRHVP